MINPKKLLYYLVLGEFDELNYNRYLPDNGIALLAAYIKQLGNSVKYFDLNIAENLEKFIATACKEKPDIIGFKLFYNNLRSSFSAALRIKRLLPNCILVAGGPQVSLYREKIYKIGRVFDLLIVGEGDEAITQIGEYALGKRDINDITNCIYEYNGSMYKNKSCVLSNLDEIPLPDWETIQIHNYFPILQLNMSRGCPHQCSFCVHNAILSRNKTPEELIGKTRLEIHKCNLVRIRKFNQIKYEVESSLARFGTKLFVIPDSTPIIGMLDKFCDFINERQLAIKWSSFARIGEFSQNIYWKLAKCGCVSMFFGIESGDDNILASIGKKYTKPDIVKSISYAKNSGIDIIGSFIMGYPGENEISISNTKELVSLLRLPTVFMSPFALEPGSPISYYPQNYQIQLHQDWLDKTVLLPQRLDFQDIYYYDINGIPNNVWWKQVEQKYSIHEMGINIDVFDNEYIKLLASLLGCSSSELYKRIFKILAAQDFNSMRELIAKCWAATV